MNILCTFSKEEKNKVCEYTAKNLRMMRKKLNLKQGDLAELTGTTHRRISEIENGKIPLSWTLYLAIVTVFSLNSATRNTQEYREMVSDNIVRFISGGEHDKTSIYMQFNYTEKSQDKNS